MSAITRGVKFKFSTDQQVKLDLPKISDTDTQESFEGEKTVMFFEPSNEVSFTDSWNKYVSLKEANLSKIREITKPILRELNTKISDVRSIAPTFGFDPVKFSPKYNVTSYWSFFWKDIIGKKDVNDLYIKKLLKTYDMEQFKQNRILKHFTYGK